jgi:hypothetical protein
MKRIVRLTERDLSRIVRRVINENEQTDAFELVAALEELSKTIKSMIVKIRDENPDEPVESNNVTKMRTTIESLDEFIMNAINFRLTAGQQSPASDIYQILTMGGNGGFRLTFTRQKFVSFFNDLKKIFNSKYDKSYESEALDMINYYTDELKKSEFM